MASVQSRVGLGDRAAMALLMGVFALSRIACYLVGVRFDLHPLYSYYQFVDPELLRHRLWETSWYMHTQPPGFNFLVGLVLQFVNNDAVLTLIFGSFYAAMGAASLLILYRLQRDLDVPSWLALTLCSLFAISPGVLLQESFFLYEYPQMFALLLASWSALRFFRTGAKAWALTFFAVVAALPVFRATYHLLWAVLIAIVFAFLVRRSAQRRQFRFAAAIGALACLPCLVLYAKNEKLYGQFAGSTWLGEQASTVTVWQLTPEKREELIAKGVISTIGRIPAAAPLDQYVGYLHPVPPTGIPILDQVKDSTNRDNLNNLLYLQTGQLYIRDAKTLLRVYPQCYLKSVAIAWFTYFLPASDFPFFEVNRPKIIGWDRFYNLVFQGQWKDASDRKALRREGAGPGMILYEAVYLIILFPTLFCFGCWRLWREWRKDSPSIEWIAALAFVIFTIATVSFISTMLSSFECNRYRFPLDPLFVLLGGLAVSQYLRFRSRPTRT